MNQVAQYIFYFLVGTTVLNFFIAVTARAKTGKRMAASNAMIAITTSSSINVNPARERGTWTQFFCICFIGFSPSRLGLCRLDLLPTLFTDPDPFGTIQRNPERGKILATLE